MIRLVRHRHDAALVIDLGPLHVELSAEWGYGRRWRDYDGDGRALYGASLPLPELTLYVEFPDEWL